MILYNLVSRMVFLKIYNCRFQNILIVMTYFKVYLNSLDITRLKFEVLLYILY